MEITKIRELAERFRRAIDSLPPEDLKGAMKDFPHGACMDTSVILCAYFERNAVYGFQYFSGEREKISSIDEFADLESHTWLQHNDLIVDITADQFPDVSEPVIVTADSRWHNQFNGSPRRNIGFDNDLRVLYPKLLRAMDELSPGKSTKPYP